MTIKGDGGDYSKEVFYPPVLPDRFRNIAKLQQSVSITGQVQFNEFVKVINDL